MGSSPLTRGKHGGGLSCIWRGGLIPAHAGKTRYARRPIARREAHPRSRGENNLRGALPKQRNGSSPLTRGKRRTPVRCNSRIRLIPAHAGKTFRRPTSICGTWAHPRSRGENTCFSRAARNRVGSSPLTRGKLAARGVPLRGVGLIPAHAGKTYRAIPGRFSGRAHPRSRGENSLDGLVVDLATGSSPLTRGKHMRPTPSQFKQGLIPAHAGKTPAKLASAIEGGAHPRSRGENAFHPAIGHTQTGSSPLTRGKQLLGEVVDRRSRLIPAHAGKTVMREFSIASVRAHPRSRGENEPSRHASSEICWLIPAHAGKT